MKGIVFTEFMELVETAYGMEMVDRIIELVNPPSGGAYTAVGTYDHGEMVALVGKLSDLTGVPVPQLLKIYGRHLFSRFVAFYPRFFANVRDCFGFLEQIEGHIHKEVLKLYPDAELPTFSHRRKSPDELELVYRSSRAMSDFAEGLIEGCAAHFSETLEISKQPMDGDSGTVVQFLIRRVGGKTHG